jgi:hypothetical protein
MRIRSLSSFGCVSVCRRHRMPLDDADRMPEGPIDSKVTPVWQIPRTAV